MLIAFPARAVAAWALDVSALPHELSLRRSHGTLPPGFKPSSPNALEASHVPLIWEIDASSFDSIPHDWSIPIPSPTSTLVDTEEPNSNIIVPHKLAMCAPWYLQGRQLPLRFDATYERKFWDEGLLGVRYQLVSTHNPGAPLRLEVVSTFRFPKFRASFEALQIPGYFTVGAGPLEKNENRPGWDSMKHYHWTIFVYEPLSEDGQDVDGALGRVQPGSGIQAGTMMLSRDIGSERLGCQDYTEARLVSTPAYQVLAHAEPWLLKGMKQSGVCVWLGTRPNECISFGTASPQRVGLATTFI